MLTHHFLMMRVALGVHPSSHAFAHQFVELCLSAFFLGQIEQIALFYQELDVSIVFSLVPLVIAPLSLSFSPPFYQQIYAVLCFC